MIAGAESITSLLLLDDKYEINKSCSFVVKTKHRHFVHCKTVYVNNIRNVVNVSVIL